MVTRQCWRYPFSVKVYFTLILLLMVQIIHASTNDDQSAQFQQSKPQFSSNPESLRRDIASISVTEVNRSRNLRQAYDDNPYKYTEILPAHSNHHFHSEFDNNVERNSSDNRKPAFYACKDYAPKVKEEQPWNTFVIKVDAEDPDEYDTITYSFEKSANERAKFRINEKTGEITTSYTFDRDEPIREKEVSQETKCFTIEKKKIHRHNTGNCILFIYRRERKKKNSKRILLTWHKRCAKIRKNVRSLFFSG